MPLALHLPFPLLHHTTKGGRGVEYLSKTPKEHIRLHFFSTENDEILISSYLIPLHIRWVFSELGTFFFFRFFFFFAALQVTRPKIEICSCCSLFFVFVLFLAEILPKKILKSANYSLHSDQKMEVRFFFFVPFALHKTAFGAKGGSNICRLFSHLIFSLIFCLFFRPFSDDFPPFFFLSFFFLRALYIKRYLLCIVHLPFSTFF